MSWSDEEWANCIDEQAKEIAALRSEVRDLKAKLDAREGESEGAREALEHVAEYREQLSNQTPTGQMVKYLEGYARGALAAIFHAPPPEQPAAEEEKKP